MNGDRYDDGRRYAARIRPDPCATCAVENSVRTVRSLQPRELCVRQRRFVVTGVRIAQPGRNANVKTAQAFFDSLDYRDASRL